MCAIIFTDGKLFKTVKFLDTNLNSNGLAAATISNFFFFCFLVSNVVGFVVNTKV